MSSFLKEYKNQIIAAAVVFVLLINFALVPYLYRRQATSIVIKVLELWKRQDNVATAHYWVTPEESPPIYSLESYKITKKTFDKKNGRNHAVFLITLNFSENNLLPSGKTWQCDILNTKTGWKITDFSVHTETEEE